MIYAILALCVMGACWFAGQKIREHGKEWEGKLLSGGKARLKMTVNRGFAGNRMENSPAVVRNVSVISTLFVLILFIYILRSKERPFVKTCLALAVGGAAANTAERLSRGEVTDYLQFMRKGKPGKYIYNLADLCIGTGSACGIAALIKNCFLK